MLFYFVRTVKRYGREGMDKWVWANGWEQEGAAKFLISSQKYVKPGVERRYGREVRQI